jgi:hypothetical protein
MIKDKIQNKIQLEIININKTIANKRRETESKEEIKLRNGMNFFMASMQSEEKRKEKKRNFKSNHVEPLYTCLPERKRMTR